MDEVMTHFFSYRCFSVLKLVSRNHISGLLNTCNNIKRGTLEKEDAAIQELQWTYQHKSSSNNRESSQSPWQMPMNSPWKGLPLPCSICSHSLHTHTEQREDER